MTPERIESIRAMAQSFSGLQYVVTHSRLQWPWTSSETTNQIVDLVRAVPEVLDALATVTARAEALERENEALSQDMVQMMAQRAERDASYARLHEQREAMERERTPVPGTYACQTCGRRDGLDAVVTNAVWEQIRGGLNLLCLWCIDRRCQAEGIVVSASLHFAGVAITGTSQSDADQEHINRVCAERDALAREVARLRTALKFYADSAIYECDTSNDHDCDAYGCWGDIDEDQGKVAIDALAAAAGSGQEGPHQFCSHTPGTYCHLDPVSAGQEGGAV